MKREFVINRHGKDYVLYAGLLDEAHSQGLTSIKTSLVQAPTAQNGNVAICLAEVTTEKGTFTGIGDADPGNVNRMMTNALIRLAETRAKARALRDAVNVGMVALEELAENASETLSLEDIAPHEPPAGIVSLPSVREGLRQAAQAEPALRAPTPLPAAGPSIGESTEGEAAERARGALPVAARARSAAPRAAAEGPPLPATQTQIETIGKLARSVGRTVSTDGLTRAAASELITRLSEERYGARRGS